jgi:capsular exopolysaccharide synthesis family protein
LLLQEKILRKDYGPGHPDVRSVQEQITLTRQFFTPSSAARESLLNPSDQNRQADPVDSYLRSLEQEAKGIEASQQVLDDEWKREQDEAKVLTEYEILDRQHTEAIARITRYYDSLLEQLQGIGLNKDLVGYRMRVIAPATVPVQVEPRLVLVLSLAILLGLVGGFGWGWASEARDTSLRTPEEIWQRFGLPVFGCIPRLAQLRAASAARIAQDPMLDSVLCVHYRPESAEAEAYREVRTALCFSILGKKDRVIQITSPNVGDGKTTLASNLAVSLARSGHQVLLMDADLRRPRIHELFGRSSQIGLTSVVRGDAALEEAVQPSGIPGLSILASGPLPVDPADLLTTRHFQELLDAVREQYEFVLIDSSALLVATDARVVAARADAVLLTVRFAKNGRPQLQRSREILEQLEANLLGAVVNASSQHAEFGPAALGDGGQAAAGSSNNGRDAEADGPKEPAE